MTAQMTITPKVTYQIEFASEDRTAWENEVSYERVSQFLSDLTEEAPDVIVALRSDAEDYKPREMTLSEARAEFE